MSTDNQQQEIWKKFNKQPGAAGAPRLTPEEEKKLNLRQIVIYLALTFLLTYSTEIFGIIPMVGSCMRCPTRPPLRLLILIWICWSS